jgi:hypothetical protein
MSLRELIEKYLPHESHKHSSLCYSTHYSEENLPSEYLSCPLMAGHYKSQCSRCQVEAAILTHDAQVRIDYEATIPHNRFCVIYRQDYLKNGSCTCGKAERERKNAEGMPDSTRKETPR